MTGVQTCALPISKDKSVVNHYFDDDYSEYDDYNDYDDVPQYPDNAVVLPD